MVEAARIPPYNTGVETLGKLAASLGSSTASAGGGHNNISSSASARRQRQQRRAVGDRSRRPTNTSLSNASDCGGSGGGANNNINCIQSSTGSNTHGGCGSSFGPTASAADEEDEWLHASKKRASVRVFHKF
jgi:hypothetical protein